MLRHDLKIIYSFLLLTDFLYLPYACGQDNLFGSVQSIGGRELYGINDASVLKSQTASATYYPYATRHRRRGEDTGIGGSFLGTGAPTVESTPATVPLMVHPVVERTVHVPITTLSIYKNINKK